MTVCTPYSQQGVTSQTRGATWQTVDGQSWFVVKTAQRTSTETGSRMKKDLEIVQVYRVICFLYKCD